MLLSVALVLAGCGGGGPGEPSPPGGIVVGGAEPVQCGTSDVSGFASVVYVDAASSTKPPSCGGTTQTACPTIGDGIAQCKGVNCGVLVRHGLYAEALVLRDGVSVIGACRFVADVDTPGIPLALYRTVLDVKPSADAPGIAASGLSSATRVEGLVVLMRDAVEPGSASIALAVQSSPQLVVRNTTLSSGAGAPGAPGAPDTPDAGETGGPGISTGRAQGGRACAPRPIELRGGLGGQSQELANVGCLFSICNCGTRTPSDDVTGGAAGASSGRVAGGSGASHTFPSGQCSGPASEEDYENHHGGGGSTGACSQTAGVASPDVYGDLQGTRWVASRGGDGQPGDVGSGGGGGASGGACEYTKTFLGNDPNLIPGGAGGGGGGGGCGGRGNGAQQGGASIPLVIAATTLGNGWGNNVFVPGPGGAGGRGADGGSGGPGGAGGRGRPNGGIRVGTVGSGDRLCSGAGGNGGDGGHGGAGAGGAGGNGGPSFGIALVQGAQYTATGGLYKGQPGAAGAGGGPGTNGSCTAVRGNDGSPGGTSDSGIRIYAASSVEAAR